jgi:hypothetical protein
MQVTEEYESRTERCEHATQRRGVDQAVAELRESGARVDRRVMDQDHRRFGAPPRDVRALVQGRRAARCRRSQQR